MRDAAEPLLLWLCLGPVLFAAPGFLGARWMPRWLCSALVVGGWLSSLVLWVMLLQRELSLGGWEEMQVSGFRGVRLVALSSAQGPWLLADPLRLVLGGSLVIAGLIAVIHPLVAVGGGPRTIMGRMGRAGLLGELLLYGVLQCCVYAASLSFLIGLAMLASLLAWLLTSSADPKREQRDAAGQIFVLHRLGDLAWGIALATLVSTFGGLSLDELAPSWVGASGWERLEDGPLRGFPLRTALSLISALMILGAFARVAVLPLPFPGRTATGLPAPALGLVHGAAAVLPAFLVAFHALPLWESLPLAPSVWGHAALVTSCAAALAAGVTRDILQVDLQVTRALHALALAALFFGQFPAAALLVAMAVILPSALLQPTGVVLESTGHQGDMFALGGMWRRLPLTDRGRAIAVIAVTTFPGSAAWLAMERLLFETLDGPRASWSAAALVVSSALCLSFAAFRALHLTYSGDEPRCDCGDSVDVAWWRSASALVVSLLAVGMPLLFGLPRAIVRPWVLGYQEAMTEFLAPTWPMATGLPLTDEGTWFDDRHGVPDQWRLVGMGLLVGVCAVAFVASAVLYRGGPTLWHSRLRGVFPAARSDSLLSTSFGLDVLWLMQLPSLVERAARWIRTLVLAVVLDIVVTRAVAGVAAIARSAIRILHSGDVQRGLLLLLIVVALLLSRWGSS
ncbi:MAG: hypothetical protein ACO3JL_15350 [Myxococcota bacterium]